MPRGGWAKTRETVNEELGTDLTWRAIRSRFRRLTGDTPGGVRSSPGDPEALMKAVQVMDRPEAMSTMEELIRPKFPGIQFPDFGWAEVFETAERLSELTNDATPTITSAEVVLETDKPIAFMNTSDWHIGSRFMAYKTFRAALNLCIATPRVYWAIYGDEMDNYPLDWMPPAIMQVITPRTQQKIVHAIVDELIDHGKILYSFWSDHPAFTERKTGDNPMEPIYMGRVPYFHGKGVVKLRVGEQRYVIFASHKFKGSSIYNPTHPQMRALLWEVPSADFVIMGHRHQYAYSEVPHHDLSYLSGLHKNRVAHLLQVGTAKSGPDHYTIRGWSDGMFEWPIFVLYPGEHKVKRVYDFEDLEHFLDIKIDQKLLKDLREAAELEGGFST